MTLNKMQLQKLHISKRLIYCLISIWENKYSCADHYGRDAEIQLLSILTQSFNVTIDRGISAPEHGREAVYGLNYTDKRFIYHLVSPVDCLAVAQLTPGGR